MENKIIQPIHENIEVEQNLSFANQQAQKIAQIANTPQAQIPRGENENFKKDVEYVKMKIGFFFFTLAMLQFFFLFLILSIFLVGIPFLIFSISFYFDVQKRYKLAISKLK